jgi:hypothetical protein
MVLWSTLSSRATALCGSPASSSLSACSFLVFGQLARATEALRPAFMYSATSRRMPASLARLMFASQR